MKNLFLIFACAFVYVSPCLAEGDSFPTDCYVTCTSASDPQVKYCGQVGCCGFMRVTVETDSGEITENGTNKITSTSMSVTSPQTTLTATGSNSVYDGTLTVKPTAGGNVQTTDVTCTTPTAN